MDYYSKGVLEREPLDSKGVSKSNQRGVQKDTQGVSRRDYKEEPIKKNHKEEHLANQGFAVDKDFLEGRNKLKEIRQSLSAKMSL